MVRVNAAVECSTSLALLSLLMVIICLESTAQAQDWQIERPLGSRDVVERYREILESNPLNEPAFTGLLRELPGERGLAELVERYARLLSNRPEDASLHVLLARLRERQGQIGLAVELLDRAISLGFSEPGAFLTRARLRGQLGQLEAAQQDYELALGRLRRRDEQVDALRNLADLQLTLGQVEQAMASYQRIAELAPADAYLRRELVQILVEAGHPQEALLHAREVVRLARTNTRLRLDGLREVALLQEEMEDWEGAIQSWQEIIGLTSAGHWMLAEAQERLLVAYRKWGRLEQLLARLDARLTTSTRDLFVLAGRARILKELGRIEESLEAYRLALERRPAERALYLELAELLRSMEQYELAADLLSSALGRWPDDFELLERLVLLSIEVGELFEASFALRTYEQRHWQDLSALIATLRLYRRIGDGRASDRLIRRIQEMDPEQTRIRLEMAEAALEAGDASEGLALLRPLGDSEEPFVWEARAQLLVEHELFTEAREVVAAARARFPQDGYLALAWLRLVRDDSLEDALRAAFEVLSVADEWPLLQEAFELYLQALEELQLVPWMIERLELSYHEQIDNHRLGRTLLMLQVASGECRGATQTALILNASDLAPVNPEQIVLATLRSWPNPQSLTLLRRLGAGDPAGRWRNQLIEAGLLIQAGRQLEARALLERLRQERAESSSSLFSIAELYLELGGQDDQNLGCWLMGLAARQDPQNAGLRLAFVVCLRALGKLEPAYEEALVGLDGARDESAFDLFFDQWVMTIPAWKTREQASEEVRERIATNNPARSSRLEVRLEEWLGH